MFKYALDCMAFWGWWGCLDWKIRTGTSVIVMLIGGAFAWAESCQDTTKSYKAPIVQNVQTNESPPPPPHDYRAAILVGSIGMLMLMFSGQSESEKKGYKD